MVTQETLSRAARAKEIYDARLKDRLEATDRDRFVAIEPESGDYFLEDSLDAAVDAATRKHPDRITHVIRIGHPAAIYIGGMRS